MPTITRRVSSAITVAAISGAALAGCGREKAPEVERASDLLPANAILALSTENASALFQTLDVPALLAAHPTVGSRISKSFEVQYGIDLLDLEAAQAAGFDPAREVAVAFLDQPRGASVAVLPGDGALLAERLGNALRRGGDREARSSHRGVAIRDYGNAGAATLELPGYAIVVSGVVRADARGALCREILDGAGERSITKKPLYQRLAGDPGTDHDIVVYRAAAPGGGARSRSAAAFVPGLDLAGGESVTAIRLDPETLTIDRLARPSGADSAASAGLDGVMPAGAPSVSFLERLPSDPILIAATNLAAGRWWRYLRTAGPDTSTARAQQQAASAFVRETLGLDLETDVLAHLSGRLGILVNRIEIMGSDLVLFAELDDPAAGQALLDRAIAHLRENPQHVPFLGTSTSRFALEGSGDVPYYRLALFPVADLCLGIVRGHLVATTSLGRFQEIAAGGGGFLARIEDSRTRTELAQAPAAFIHVKLPGVAAVLEGPAGSLLAGLAGSGSVPGGVRAIVLSGRGPEIVRSFETLTVTTRIEDGLFRSSWRLRAPAPGVWSRVAAELLAGWTAPQ